MADRKLETKGPGIPQPETLDSLESSTVYNSQRGYQEYHSLSQSDHKYTSIGPFKTILYLSH